MHHLTSKAPLRKELMPYIPLKNTRKSQDDLRISTQKAFMLIMIPKHVVSKACCQIITLGPKKRQNISPDRSTAT
jgi:hypothetical protein